VAGGNLFFGADDGDTAGFHGIELWVWNGATATRLTDINPNQASSDPGNLTAVGSTLFFTASPANGDNEVWATDGTGPGTTLIKDISPLQQVGPRDLTAVGS